MGQCDQSAKFGQTAVLADFFSSSMTREPTGGSIWFVHTDWRVVSLRQQELMDGQYQEELKVKQAAYDLEIILNLDQNNCRFSFPTIMIESTLTKHQMFTAELKQYSLVEPLWCARSVTAISATRMRPRKSLTLRNSHVMGRDRGGSHKL